MSHLFGQTALRTPGSGKRQNLFGRIRTATLAATAAATILPLLSGSALAAARLRTLHTFCPNQACAAGEANVPLGGLARDGSGNLYGTTELGGAYNHGVVFELVFTGRKYKYRILHSFCASSGCPDGDSPDASLTLDVNGNVYGTTLHGGNANNAGVAFELVASRRYRLQVLHAFCSLSGCADGASPQAPLSYAAEATGALYDGTSTLYGEAAAGGDTSNGIAFQLTYIAGKPQRKWGLLHSFTGADGENPWYGLTPDANGNLYGVAAFGGASADSAGTAFEFSPNAKGFKFTLLYSFGSQANDADGFEPNGALAIDGQGRLVGVTFGGGAGGQGALYRIVPNGTNSQESVLYSFCANGTCTDGQWPSGGVAISGGTIFGTAQRGGTACTEFGGGGCGTLFEFGKKYPYFRVLHDFCTATQCADGSAPAGTLILDSAGNVYGVTAGGGSGNPYNEGTVYKLIP
jgi:uncharacterized repeat protein (TIGR03803 family)